jgi:hypothetical protein
MQVGPVRIILGAGLIAAIVYGAPRVGKALWSRGEESGARERVVSLLKNAGPGGNVEHAVSLWHHGTLQQPPTTAAFSAQADAFDAWLAQKGIAKITSFEVLDAEVVGETKVMAFTLPVVVVDVTINGRRYAMSVVRTAPIAWE